VHIKFEVKDTDASEHKGTRRWVSLEGDIVTRDCDNCPVFYIFPEDPLEDQDSPLQSPHRELEVDFPEDLNSPIPSPTPRDEFSEDERNEIRQAIRDTNQKIRNRKISLIEDMQRPHIAKFHPEIQSLLKQEQETMKDVLISVPVLQVRKLLPDLLCRKSHECLTDACKPRRSSARKFTWP
jgi:hypothetical protein